MRVDSIMISFIRCLRYCYLLSEDDLIKPSDSERLKNWPRKGLLHLKDIEMKYRPHFEAEELILPKGNDALTRYRAIIERSEVVDDSSAHLSEAFQWEIKKDRAYDFFQLARELWQEQEAITIRELLETVNKSQQPLPEVFSKNIFNANT